MHDATTTSGTAPEGARIEPEDLELVTRLEHVLGGQYCVVRRLARGGFADVFEVRDLELDRQLAVKVLREDLAPTQGMIARFKQEARALARISGHPNSVPIHFVGESQGLVYAVLTYVEGPTLADLLDRHGPLDPAVVIPLVLPVLDVLGHAHALGIVHRDLKPDNILIERRSGRPLLVDFGIAKVLDGLIHHTQTGFVVGTPLYMSPEQALGRDGIDARADIYAFGAMLFQLLTGTPPFEGETSQEIVGRHLSDPVPDAAARSARVPAWLGDVLQRCMAKDPRDRFATAHDLATALRAGMGSVLGAPSATRLLALLDTPEPPRAATPAPVAAAVPASTHVATAPIARAHRGIPTARRAALLAAGVVAVVMASVAGLGLLAPSAAVELDARRDERYLASPRPVRDGLEALPPPASRVVAAPPVRPAAKAPARDARRTEAAPAPRKPSAKPKPRPSAPAVAVVTPESAPAVETPPPPAPAPDPAVPPPVEEPKPRPKRAAPANPLSSFLPVR